MTRHRNESLKAWAGAFIYPIALTAVAVVVAVVGYRYRHSANWRVPIAGLYIFAWACETRGIWLGSRILFPREQRRVIEMDPPILFWPEEQREFFSGNPNRGKVSPTDEVEAALGQLGLWLRRLTTVVFKGEQLVAEADEVHAIQNVMEAQRGRNVAAWLIVGAWYGLLATLVWLFS